MPPGALQLLPGDGAIGAALVADARVRGVVFTGSTEAARAIQLQLSTRLDARGLPIPLVAETGGQNAMVVDSSALPEQAVADILSLGLRFRRPALLGLAHPSGAGGDRAPADRHADAARWRNSAPAAPIDWRRISGP